MFEPAGNQLAYRVAGSRWQLSWRLKWTFLCPEHAVYLVDRYPQCRSRLYWRLGSSNAGQRTYCTQLANAMLRIGRRPLGRLPVCGFPVGELPVVPVEDEETTHVQRRIDALLTPGDAAANAVARAVLRKLVVMAHVAARLGRFSLVAAMEPAVAESVRGDRGPGHDARLSSILESGAPAAISALVRIAAQAVLADDPVPGVAWFLEHSVGWSANGPWLGSTVTRAEHAWLDGLFQQARTGPGRPRTGTKVTG